MVMNNKEQLLSIDLFDKPITQKQNLLLKGKYLNRTYLNPNSSNTYNLKK